MRAIDGSTRLVGVVGTPLAHSLSPAMHNAAYEHLGLNWVYVPFEISDEVGLRRFVAASRSLDLVGFNVTMPYKRSMLDLCDEVATAARMAGAVNTVHIVDERLIGYNTDGRGLLEALELEADFAPADKEVVVIGSGGAAGAAVVAFILARAARVTIAGRDVGRARQLAERVEAYAGGVELVAVDIASAQSAVASASLIVNATPLGMQPGDASPLPVEWLDGRQVVYDMVYGTGSSTALLERASKVGSVALDGLGMLVCQGAVSVDIWSGAELHAPRRVMRVAAEAALAARAAR